jgi:hypothetical protein
VALFSLFKKVKGAFKWVDPVWVNPIQRPRSPNKKKLGLNEDLNLGPLSPQSTKLQTIKANLILCFHIKVLFPLLFIGLCIKIIVSLIHDLEYIFDCLIYIIYI